MEVNQEANRLMKIKLYRQVTSHRKRTLILHGYYLLLTTIGTKPKITRLKVFQDWHHPFTLRTLGFYPVGIPPAMLVWRGRILSNNTLAMSLCFEG